MTRLGLLLKTYSRHVRTYVVVYTLVLVSIVIPVSVSTLLSGMLDHAFVSFLHDQVMAGDVLVTPLSDNNLQAGTLPTLSGMAEYYIDEAIVNSFSSTEECTYTLYSHIGGTNQEYFIYEDLTEPGQQVSLIVSDAIPEGVFSARPSLDVPGSVYLVTGAGQSYVQLKRAEDFIPFPSAYQFDIAISRSDANRLMIPAKRAYAVINFHGASADEELAFIDELSSHEEILVYSPVVDTGLELARALASSVTNSCFMLTGLRFNVSVLLSGFALISICAMLFSAIHVHSVRKDEYALYGSLGMTRAYVRKVRLLESFITAIIPIALSWVLMAVVCVLVSQIPGPSMMLDADIGLTFTDVYCVDGNLYMPFPVAHLALYSVLYMVVVIAADLIAGRRK